MIGAGVMISEIELYLYMKLLDAGGSVGHIGGQLTIIELILILNEMFDGTKQYCGKLRHALSRAAHIMVDPDHQPRLLELQDECMNGLTNIVNTLEQNIDAAINAGFGYSCTHLRLYRSVAKLLVEIFLIHKTTQDTLGAYDDISNTELEDMQNYIKHCEDWLVVKLREATPEEWLEIVDYAVNL